MGLNLYGRYPTKRAVINAATAAAQTIVAAVPGRRIVVLGFWLRAANGQTLTWRSGTTPLTGAMAMATSELSLAASDDDHGVLETAPGEALVLLMGAATQVSGSVTYALV